MKAAALGSQEFARGVIDDFDIFEAVAKTFGKIDTIFNVLNINQNPFYSLAVTNFKQDVVSISIPFVTDDLPGKQADLGAFCYANRRKIVRNINFFCLNCVAI